MTKMLSASGGLRTRHGASQPVTPSAAYASEAEPPPLLHITTLTTETGYSANITGSYKHKQLIQQLVRSLEIRVKNTQTIKKL